MSFVGKASCVIDEMGQSVNRNVASLLDIRTGYDPRHTTGELLGDTLRVFIDLASVRDKQPPKGWSLNGAIEATVECVLATASRSKLGWDRATKKRVEAKSVHLEVRGSQEYAPLGGVFSFDSMGPLPRRREFK